MGKSEDWMEKSKTIYKAVKWVLKKFLSSLFIVVNWGRVRFTQFLQNNYTGTHIIYMLLIYIFSQFTLFFRFINFPFSVS